MYLFDGGLMVTLGNPKIMVFYVALLPRIIDLNRVTLSGWSILVGALFMILAGADMGWNFIAVRVWRLLKNRKAMRLANRSSAGMMEGAAVAIAAK
ncbi:LysE family translocator [Acidocella aminolytica]